MHFSKKLLAFGFLGTIGCAAAFGASAPVQENRPQDFSTSALPGEENTATNFLSIGPSLALYRGDVGWGGNVGFLTLLNRNLLVGADVGVHLWKDNGTNVASTYETSTRAIGLLPTVLYRFEIKGPLFPYVGLSVGPNIYRDRVSVTDATGTKVAVSTRWLFEALLRPGFFVRLGEKISLQVEPKLGFLRKDFIFLPTVGAVFAL